MIPCPYCQHDLADQHNFLSHEHADNQIDMVVILCTACGEPLVWERTYVRKPTADEHVEMMEQTRLKAAREAFLHMKQNGPIVEAAWHKYALARSREELLELRGVADVIDLLHDTFYAGAALILAFVRKAMETPDFDAFDGKLMLLEAELNAHAEMVRERKQEKANDKSAAKPSAK